MLQKTLIALAFLVSSSASAQIGSGTDIIMGRVVGPDSSSLAGARVSITSLVTAVTREVTTGSDGRFTVLFRDGGGQYRLTATFVGMQPATITVRRYASEDRLVVTIRMSGVAQQLERVDVQERADAFETAFKAGGADRTLTPQLLEKFPVNPGDLFGAALLVPGVLATAASDTSRAAFSIAAQPSVQNNVTLDGMTFLFGSVPEQAISAIRLFSNTYDVSRGQFTGGQLATTTRAGTNRVEGAANFSYRPSVLQSGGAGGAFAQSVSHLLAGGGLSGPLPRAAAFYSLAAELQHREGPSLTLQSASAATLERLGVHSDSLIRFVAALQQLDAAAPSLLRARDHSLLEASGLARLDFDVTPDNQLMVRADLRGSRQNAVRVSPYSANGGDGDEDAIGGGGMVMLSSVMGKFINEFRGYGSWERRQTHPTIRAPAGIVALTSTLDERSQVTSLQFGGNPMLPRVSRATLQEASNELSFLTEDGAHRWKLGVMVNRERAEITGINDRYGAYVYNSVSALESNAPAMYTRTLPGTGRLIGTDNAALYLANAWRRSEKLHMTYGFRIEASRLAESPPENPFVIAVFDRSTRNFLTEMRMYPRFGLTYLIGAANAEPGATVSFGIGEFRGRIPSHLLQYVNTNDGFASDSQMVCVGSFIPAADWSAFNADTSTIPRNCVVSSRLPLGEVRPNVAFWGQSAGAPRVWRSALNIEKRLGARFRAALHALYAHGQHNPAVWDENLVREPREGLFVPNPTLAALGNEPRPFYPHPAAVIPSTGAVSLSASRHYPFFSTAFELTSGVSSRAGQVTLEIAGADQTIGFLRLSHMNLAYTFMRARDESNGYPFQNSFATTSGDPSRREWGTSDLERRHSVLATAVASLAPSLELSVLGRALSGPRYTPMVMGDVNGDGFRNDRAFVFTPGSTEGDAVQRLLGSTDERARDCISSQIGRIAQRNSCTTPWYAGLDMQLNWYRDAARRVTLSLTAHNVLAGVDALLHRSNVRGWGQPVYPDNVLMKVETFDPDALAFRYTVNERFGTPSGSSSPVRVPLQLGLQVRIQMGSEATREAP